MTEILVNVQMDCEATREPINDAALGERAIRGLGEILAHTGMKATFAVIPSDLKVHAPIYRELESEGHEIGLHCHPAEQGYDKYLGLYGLDEQVHIIGEGIEVFAQCMGRKPECFTPGYFSANDHTFPALEAVGLKHGMVSCATRDVPKWAAVWGSSPLEPHYPHRHNRVLVGDVDFVDVPATVDADSRIWEGAHPQDLRVEHGDAKTHWRTIEKNVSRLALAGDAIPVKHLKVFTHNFLDYSDERDSRREALLSVIAATREICRHHGCQLAPVTTAEIAAAYRRAVPLPRGDVAPRSPARGPEPEAA